MVLCICKRPRSGKLDDTEIEGAGERVRQAGCRAPGSRRLRVRLSFDTVPATGKGAEPLAVNGKA